MSRSRKRGIWTRWALANFWGFTLGFSAHAVVKFGSHAANLGLGEFLLRTLGFSAAALFVCLAQQAALRWVFSLTWRDVVFQTGLTVSAFWIGYYGGNLPFGHLAGLIALGIALAWTLRGRIGEWKRWMWVSTAGFFGSSVIQVAAVLPARKQFVGDACLEYHLLLWTYLGLFAGIASGALSGWQLARSLRARAVVSRPLELEALLSRRAA